MSDIFILRWWDPQAHNAPTPPRRHKSQPQDFCPPARYIRRLSSLRDRIHEPVARQVVQQTCPANDPPSNERFCRDRCRWSLRVHCRTHKDADSVQIRGRIVLEAQVNARKATVSKDLFPFLFTDIRTPVSVVLLAEPPPLQHAKRDRNEDKVGPDTLLYHQPASRLEQGTNISQRLCKIRGSMKNISSMDYVVLRFCEALISRVILYVQSLKLKDKDRFPILETLPGQKKKKKKKNHTEMSAYIWQFCVSSAHAQG
ncbi:hypothetical protein VTO42DRAFT_1085 [Malbranchea cinnamomea]